MKEVLVFKVGDEVQVILPSGVFVGIIKEEFQDYAWTGDTWCCISGNKPRPFLTTARKANLMPVHEIYRDKKEI